MLLSQNRKTNPVISIALVLSCMFILAPFAKAQDPLEPLDVRLEALTIADDIYLHFMELPFSVTVRNYEGFAIQYRLVFSLTVTNSPVVNGEVIFGYTRVGTDTSKYYGYLPAYGSEDIDNSDIDKVSYLNIDPEFNSMVAGAGRGRLPAGDYTMQVSVQTDRFGDGDELYFVDPLDTPYADEIEETRTITIPVAPLLNFPTHQSVVTQSNPTFSWYSLEVSPGVGVFYNIRICLKEEGQSDEEAMENLSYWTNDWGGLNVWVDDPVVLDVPGQINISWTYPQEADPLIVGREFVWQIEAYDEAGLYGWDEVDPVVSEIWSFRFGEPPELLMPDDGMTDVGTVRPTFIWSTVPGALNYEIWFGGRDDPLVELPIWDAIVPGASYTYPVDAPPLVPLTSYPYYWKVRANPLEPIPGDWSLEIFQFSVIPIEPLTPPEGSFETTILPTFSWSTPADVGGYEFRISTVDDDMVESPIFTQMLTLTSFTYPIDAPPLTPGKTFKWKVLATDENENILGEVEEYLLVRSFNVQPISLTSPSNGALVTTATPFINWETPVGVPNFEFRLSEEDDPLVENPVYTQVVPSPSFQFTGVDFPLAPGKIYYWKVIALDANEVIIGTDEDYPEVFSFMVQSLDLTSPSDGSIETTCRPYFSWTALQGLDFFEFRLGTSDDLEVESPIYTYQISGIKSFTYPSDADFLLCCETGGPYYWMVVPLDENGNPIGDPAIYPKRGFSIIPISLIAPEDGEILNTLIPNFSWEVPQYLPGSVIKFSEEDDPTIESPIVSIPVQGTNFIPLENEANFGPGRTYYCSVVAADNTGSECGIIPEVSSFSFPTLTLISPDEGEVLDNACPQLSWELLSGVPNYQIVITDAEEGMEIFSEITTTSPFSLPVSLGPGKTYLWRVEAINSDGEIIGEPSVERSLFISPIELLSPIEGNLISSLMPVFNWQSPSCLNAFKIRVLRIEDDYIIFEQEGIQGVSFTYPTDAEVLDWETSYQWTIQGMSDEGLVGKESAPAVFLTPPQPETLPPIVIDVSFIVEAPTVPPRPTVSISLQLGTDHYTITFAWDPEMSDVFHQEEGLTVLSYTYPEEATEIPWETPIYIQIAALDENDDPFGNPTHLSDVFSIISAEYPIKPAPTLSVEVPVYAPINPSFSWSNVVGVTAYRLIVSAGEEVNENGILSAGFFDFFTTGTDYTWIADDPVLDYETQYFAQVMGYVEEELISEPSSIVGFVTGQRPGASGQPVISIIIEGPDPLIPTVYLTTAVTEVDNYVLTFSLNEDMSDPFWTSPAIATFPFVYPADAPELDFNTTYYVQVQGYIGEESHGLQSDIVSFTTGDEPGASEQPIFTITTPEEAPLFPVFDITVSVTGATGYQISIATSEDMSDVIWTSEIVTSFPYTYSTANPPLEYNTTYYTQIQAFKEDNPHGLLSTVMSFTTGIEPGSNEQPEIAVSFGPDPLLPIFNLVIPVTGAEAYQIFLSNDPEVSDPFWTSEVITTFPFTYTATAPPLEYGSIYYAQAIAIKEGEPHGFPSNVLLIQTPFITRPVLLDEPLFSWIGTDPPSSAYEIRVSPLEDISIIIWSEIVSATSIAPPEGVFDWGTTYYWQVQGMDSEGNPFGDPSTVGFFTTETVEPPSLISPVDVQITSIYPTFSWSAVTQAVQYEIIVGEDEGMVSVLWSEVTSDVSITYPQDALRLSRERAYYWQVIALNGDGDPLASSVIASFQTPEPITPTELISPVDETVTTIYPTFMWNAVTEAVQYEIIIAEDEALTSVLWSALTTETNITYPEDALRLGYGRTYYWRVTTLDADGELITDPSLVASFQTPAFQPPDLIAPVSVAVTSLTPTFLWSAVEGAVSYQITIGTVEDLSEVMLTATVTTTEYTYTPPPELAPETTNYWQVQALDGDGNPFGDPSVIASFTTPVIAEITLYSPVDIVVSSLTPTFRWATLEDAAAYRITVKLEGETIWSDVVEVGEIVYPGEPPLEYETTYNWDVQPLDSEGNPIGNNPQATFTTPSLIRVTLTSPIGVTVETLTPTFTWEEVEGAAGYRIEVSENADMSDPLWGTTVGLTSISYPGDPPLELGVTYYWRVRAVDQAGEEIGEWSEIATFDVTPPPVIRVVLTSPVEAEISTVMPTFTWEELEGAAGYRIEVSENADMSELLWTATVGLVTIQYPGEPALVFDVVYYWRVMAVDLNGEELGDWSEIASFQITTTFIVTLTSPVGVDVFTLTPTFTWEAIEAAAKYRITVASDEDLSEILWSIAEIEESSTPYPSLGVPSLEFGETYYWRVQALDSEGNPLGDPSTIASFTISMVLIPELITPVEIQVETTNPVFSWSEVAGAAKYAIWVSSEDDFSVIMYQNLNVETTGITYPVSGAVALEYEQTYWWRVQALNEEGLPLGDPSPAAFFITPTGEIEIVIDYGP